MKEKNAGTNFKPNKHDKILVLFGTNRKNSLTEQVGTYYVDLLKNNGIEPDILKLTKLPADFTKSALYENNGKNEIVNQLKHQIDKAQKIVIIMPEYNGSFPGVLKAFIDALEFPKTLEGKKIGLIGVSAGPQGCVLGISHLSDILNHLGAFIYPLKLKLKSIPKEDINEVLKIKDYKDLLKRHAKEIIFNF